MIIALAYLFYFVAATASPLQRRWLAVKRDQDSQIMLAFHTLLIISVGGLILPLFSPFSIHGNTVHVVLLSLVCAVSGALFILANYTAQKHVDAGVTNLVINLYTPVSIILATLFLNEALSGMQVIGTVLLLSAVVIVSKKHRLGRFKFDRYFLMMVLSGVMLGIAITAERGLMKTTGFSAGTLLSWWSQCLALGILVLATRSKRVFSVKDTVITGSLRFFQALSWVTLLNVVGNLSVVSSVTTFKVVVVFGAAAIWLHETEDMKRKVIGCIIALVGLMLMK